MAGKRLTEPDQIADARERTGIHREIEVSAAEMSATEMSQIGDETRTLSVRSLLQPLSKSEDFFQQSLRPASLEEYIGQQRLRENLSISITAAKRRGESLDHVLLHGPPGLGKTTLAAVIAHELGVSFRATSGPVLERPGDLAAVLSGLGERDVLFIDEIHRLPRVVEEILYPAMEDYEIDIIVGQGPAARSVKLNIKPFTLVGATTRTGLLTAPLRDRFGIIERIEFYIEEELEQIVRRSARILGVAIEEEGARQIARRSRGTPRIANRLLKRVRDFADAACGDTVTGAIASRALDALDVDQLGFDKMDRLLMLTIIDKFGGGPVGVETLAAALHDEKSTIEEVYEPYLLQQGFLKRTPRGREATLLAYQHFGRRAPAGLISGPAGVTPLQSSLFPSSVPPSVPPRKLDES